MLTAELSFDYPANLIATEKKSVSRVMYVDGGKAPMEMTTSHLLTQMSPDLSKSLKKTSGKSFARPKSGPKAKA